MLKTFKPRNKYIFFFFLECAGSGRKSTICISVLQQIDPSINECQALIITSEPELRDQVDIVRSNGSVVVNFLIKID